MQLLDTKLRDNSTIELPSIRMRSNFVVTYFCIEQQISSNEASGVKMTTQRLSAASTESGMLILFSRCLDELL